MKKDNRDGFIHTIQIKDTRFSVGEKVKNYMGYWYITRFEYLDGYWHFYGTNAYQPGSVTEYVGDARGLSQTTAVKARELTLNGDFLFNQPTAGGVKEEVSNDEAIFKFIEWLSNKGRVHFDSKWWFENSDGKEWFLAKSHESLLSIYKNGWVNKIDQPSPSNPSIKRPTVDEMRTAFQYKKETGLYTKYTHFEVFKQGVDYALSIQPDK